MILADTLSISINLLLVAHVVISLLLILVVLMQRPKQEGLGAAFGGGMTDQMFGAQTTNVLQKGTVYLGSAFLILSLVLAILIGNKNYTAKMNEPKAETVEEAPAVPAPDPEAGSIMEEVNPVGEGAPAGSADSAPTTGGDATADPTAPSGEPAPAAGDDSAGDDASGSDTSDASTGSEATGDSATGDSAGGDAAPADEGSEDKPE